MDNIYQINAQIRYLNSDYQADEPFRAIITQGKLEFVSVSKPTYTRA